MSLSAFALVLAAACCHAVWNYFVKRVVGGPERVWLFSALSALIYLPLAIAVFNALAYILVLYALTFTSVVYVAPTRELSVLLTVLMGSILLGEGELARRLGWAMLILAGVALLACGKAMQNK